MACKKCGEAFSLNTGRPGCATLMDVIEGLYLVPEFGSNGLRNTIDLVAFYALSLVARAAFIAAKLSAADPLDRWYPIQGIENFDAPIGDPVYEEFLSGRKQKVKNGTRSYTFLLPHMEAAFFGILEGVGCANVAVFGLDHSGQLIGMEDVKDVLRPIRIYSPSFYASLKYPTFTTGQNIMVAFDIANGEFDRYLSIMPAEDLGTNVLLSEGLFDVNMEVSGITATGFVANFHNIYGPAGSAGKVDVPGLVTADFNTPNAELFNSTTGLPVTVTSATEGADGVYTFVFAAQTAGDKLYFRGIAKSKWDFTATKETPITAV